MSLPLELYLFGFFSAVFITGLAIPAWRAVCRHIGLVDDPGYRKIHHTAIPLAGGLAIITGLVIPLVALAAVIHLGLLQDPLSELLEAKLSRRAFQLAAIAFGAIGMLVIGVCDDKWELRPILKFGGQFAVAMIVTAAGIRLEIFSDAHWAGLLANSAITVLWILTVINAFNFMDNMNGLCAGVGAIGAFYCGVMAAMQGQKVVALLAFLVMGALLGFLPFNFPKASVFLGDAGSHLVGFLLAALAVMPQFFIAGESRIFDLFSPLLIVAIPLADLVWVVLLRTFRGKPFYIGDTNHLSHQLVRRGLSQTTAVMVIWMVAAAVGALAFL